MGDRIDIKDSVIMGDVKIENTGNLPISCNCCNKAGYFSTYFCEACQERYCEECTSFIPGNQTIQCISCALDFTKQTVDYAYPLFEIFHKNEINDLVELDCNTFFESYKEKLLPPHHAYYPDSSPRKYVQITRWRVIEKEEFLAKIQSDPLHFFEIYKSLLEIFGNYSLSEIKSVYDADCGWDYKMRVYLSPENKGKILEEAFQDRQESLKKLEDARKIRELEKKRETLSGLLVVLLFALFFYSLSAF